MKKFLALIAPALFAVPMVAAAQAPDLGYFEALVQQIGSFIDLAIPVLIGLAVLAILFGLMRYAFAAGNEEAQAEGKRIMVWGVIILFVMVSIWGLVNLLQSVSGVENTQAPDVGDLTPTGN